MKVQKRLLFGAVAAALSLALFCSCADKKKDEPEADAALEKAAKEKSRTIIEPALLPNRFSQPGYIVNEDGTKSPLGENKDADLKDLQLKVGANITTREPITLREAMKALVKNKNMSLSWASDVDQDLVVDIDVTANDNFYEAVDNILRQLDYFHEVEGSTLVIKYRETKQYHIAMPFIKQDYKSSTGSTSGAVSSDGNKFDLWENIQSNIDKIISTWTASVINAQVKKEDGAGDKKNEGKAGKENKEDKKASVETVSVSRRVSSTDSTYTIDKPVGLITVHAPKSLQQKIADYLARLEKELYKQIIIEAKIIEVQLNDSSSLGINWNMLLQNLSWDGIRYGKSSTYSRDTEDQKQTTSSIDYSDTTTDTTTNTTANKSSNKSTTASSTASGTEGASNQASSSSSTKGDTNSSTTTDNSTFGTGVGKNINKATDILSGSTGENTSGESSDSSLNSTTTGSNSSETGSDSSSESSSTSNVARTITDALTKGTAAATLITSASGISEAISTGVTLTGFNFTSFIKALQAQGQTSILSNPKISVMNGQPALISVGRNVTYIKEVKTSVDGQSGTMSSSVTTDNILSGIGLALSAVINDNNEIVMNLVPITAELSEPINYVQIGQGNQIGLPVVNKREISTTVKIKNDSMLVVGGLISESESKSGDSLFGTRNIPYLKYLFGYEEKKNTKRELIILMKPHIIN